MKTIEIHLPCLSVSYFSRNSVHPRWENKIEINYNNKHYIFYYCTNCINGLSSLSSDYSETSKILNFIIENSGLFVPVKLSEVISPSHIIFDSEYYDEWALVWHRNNRDHYESIDELKANKDFDLIYDKSANIYFAYNKIKTLI